MLVLGESSQNKGKQLETLTQTLLRRLGYENCSTNVMASGAEIDVKGNYPIREPGGTVNQILICECKALAGPVDMTQWSKFLGKVFHADACESVGVRGCFIALSGVNGHVQGNYDELIRHKQTVSLLHGDQLMSSVFEMFGLPPIGDVVEIVARRTQRTSISATSPTTTETSTGLSVSRAGRSRSWRPTAQRFLRIRLSNLLR